ncbi:hypothetical protein DCO59_05875 [Helicobacter saguini]|uniref:hypothetical protein n=1 Tax=Helicobacter saguini TaxID=1548018 RepID=UPI000E596279|nr:hypothetical protein [Helicobacter saguini]MWV71890.1 hypothetical protein [Helicobacter saguini]
MNFITFCKKNKGFVVATLCVFLLCLGIRIYYANQKVDMHLDEVLSITLSEYNEMGWSRGFESDRIYSSDELKKGILWNDSSVLGAINDVGNLWKNNRDSPHTNLYYSLLRLWHIGFESPYSTDLSDVYMRSISLNLVFFSLSFLMAFLLVRILFKDSIDTNGGGGGIII